MDKPRRKSGAVDRSAVEFGLNRRRFKDPPSTIFIRVESGGFESSGVREGDLVVADRSAEPCDRCLVVASVGGRQVVMRYEEKRGRKFLTGGGGAGKPVEVRKGGEASVLAVVTHTIHTLEE
ncbi:MAG TPA: S24 family peptidase [Pyrinomonadaceae bacterium]|jgi:DNA polymerase V